MTECGTDKTFFSASRNVAYSLPFLPECGRPADSSRIEGMIPAVRLKSESIDWSDFVNPQRFSGYVREIERHKSRNDCTSYEAVYIAEPVERKSPIGVPFADLYWVGQCWLEIEVVFVLFGHTHLHCIFLVEILELDSGNPGDERVDSCGVDRDDLMLVDIAKFVQLPKGMSLRRVRSLVRLNSINLSPDIVGESPQSFGIVAPSIPIAEVFGNREVNVPGGVPSSVGFGHLPSHLIEAGAETVQEFSKFHSKHGIESFQLKPFDVASVLRVVLGNDGVRFFHVSGHVPIESVKVKLCPFRFLYEIPCSTRNHFAL
jgi:hypothetical protein